MKSSERTYSVDHLMRNVALMLVRDFRVNLDDPGFCSHLYEVIQRKDVAGIRKIESSLDYSGSVANFKATYQMENLMKRYRFEKDLFSDQELLEKAVMSFHETQDRIRAINLSSVSANTEKVLTIARIYIAKVLGVYDANEHQNLCRFGRRASVGIPAREACEAARWELPISGSQTQINWFDSVMSQNDQVQEYWLSQLDSDPNRSVYQEIESLTLTLVPKTFKSFRSIMPNSTIGTYMSYGLGEMIRKRLKRKGYDISSLQERHKVLARRGSKDGSLVTADLSAASDSISVALLRRLLPSDWLDILIQSRIGKVRLPDSSTCEMETFCTMGIGYTFPLQTLVFLSLLKAISFCLHGLKSRFDTISVYGDDMIYPPSMHDSVVECFTQIGFVINLDKTFHEGFFRESCGGDFFHGVDVRPFSPKSGPANVGPKTYEAVLYKFLNGLLRRWSEYEIHGTLQYLLSEIGKLTGKAKIVPVDYPDDSGICTSWPHCHSFLRGRSDVSSPKSVGHGCYRFSYLRLVSDLRKEVRHVPYFWLAIRRDCSIPYWYDSQSREAPDSLVQRLIADTVGISGYTPTLIWRESDLTRRSSLTGRRLRRLNSFVTISHTGKYRRQSGISCFGMPQS